MVTKDKSTTPDPNNQVYTQPYTPEAQLEALGRIAQALERVADKLEEWGDWKHEAIRIRNLGGNDGN